MSGYTYEAIWPVTDPAATLPALIRQAAAEFEVMAMTSGARLVGDATWTLTPGRLIARAPAVPVATDLRVRPWESGREDFHDLDWRAA